MQAGQFFFLLLFFSSVALFTPQGMSHRILSLQHGEN